MEYPTIDLAADSRPFQRQATRASVIAVMTAACIVSNYLLIGVFNVKLMDLIVFSSGFLFGPSVGASVGILTWLVYGTLNPYGFSLPVLVATSLMESVYGIVGGIIGKRGKMGVGLTSNLSAMISITYAGSRPTACHILLLPWILAMVLFAWEPLLLTQ